MTLPSRRHPVHSTRPTTAISSVRLLPLIALLATLAAAPTPVRAQEAGGTPDLRLDAAARERVIDQVLEQVTTHYVFPDVADSAAKLIRTRRSRGDYTRITSGRRLADTLTQDLVKVSGDRHLGIGFSTEPRSAPGSGGLDLAEERERRRRTLERRNFGFRRVEVLEGNVGYVDLRRLDDPALAGETGAAAMTFVANGNALILDLRKCIGGYAGMTTFLASYLFEEAVELSGIYMREDDRTKQFWTHAHVPGERFGVEKPVYVLTSGRTFSACEGLAYDLQNLERATVVGAVTGGGANPSRPFVIERHFMFFVPVGRAVSPVTGTNWEGTGVEPDVAVPAAAAPDRAHLLALRALLESSRDPDRRSELEAVIDSLETGPGAPEGASDGPR